MTNFILVPGMWLGGWAWDAVAAPLRSAGHDVTAVTLGGLAERAAEAPAATMDSHVADIVAAAGDRDDLTLVGHSYGGFLVRAAVERLGSRVTRVVYVDSGPVPDGSAQADFNGPQARAKTEASLLTGPDGALLVPPPSFEPADDPVLHAGLGELAAWIRERATPHPWSTVAAPVRVSRPEQPPTDLVVSTFDGDTVRSMIADGHPFFAGLDRRAYRVLELPTGHWPLFSRPADLAALLLS